MKFLCPGIEPVEVGSHMQAKLLCRLYAKYLRTRDFQTFTKVQAQLYWWDQRVFEFDHVALSHFVSDDAWNYEMSLRAAPTHVGATAVSPASLAALSSASPSTTASFDIANLIAIAQSMDSLCTREARFTSAAKFHPLWYKRVCPAANEMKRQMKDPNFDHRRLHKAGMTMMERHEQPGAAIPPADLSDILFSGAATSTSDDAVVVTLTNDNRDAWAPVARGEGPAAAALPIGIMRHAFASPPCSRTTSTQPGGTQSESHQSTHDDEPGAAPSASSIKRAKRNRKKQLKALKQSLGAIV